MLELRKNLAKTIESACKNSGKGGDDTVILSAKEHNDLLEENRKLKYQVKHLKRALNGDIGEAK